MTRKRELGTSRFEATDFTSTQSTPPASPTAPGTLAHARRGSRYRAVGHGRASMRLRAPRARSEASTWDAPAQHPDRGASNRA
jgi:hypothetical protein